VSELIAFWASFAASALFAGPVLKGLIALKSRQNVYNLAPETHQKKQGTPTMGGLIILLGLVVGTLVADQDWKVCLWVLGFALIGFADDFIVPRLMKGKRGLGWKQKLLPQAVLAVLAAPVFHLHWDAWTVGVSAFVVLFYCNAYNFADGLDGMAGTLGILICFGLDFLGTFLREPFPHMPLTALLGAIIPFLFLNAPPARVFMGDVGSLPIGALFGAASSVLMFGHYRSGFALGAPGNDSAHMLVPVLILSFVMIAELVPVPMQVAYFKLTKKRLFPMTPIHHSFEVKGWPESRVVWTFILAQLLLLYLALGVNITFINQRTHELNALNLGVQR